MVRGSGGSVLVHGILRAWTGVGPGLNLWHLLQHKRDFYCQAQEDNL